MWLIEKLSILDNCLIFVKATVRSLLIPIMIIHPLNTNLKLKNLSCFCLHVILFISLYVDYRYTYVYLIERLASQSVKKGRVLVRQAQLIHVLFKCFYFEIPDASHSRA